MAANVFVVDSSFRRTQIKVSPNTYLRSVLEEACGKLKLDPDQYTLKTDKQKQIDLALTYRLSGLVSGAKLQLVQASRSPSVVNVALQLPESEKSARLQDKFPSNTSLWLVLRKFEEGVAGGGSAQKLNLTSRGAPSTDQGAGRLNYEQPCLNIMGRDLSSFTDLQRTLAQLGYNSGSVLIRLTFRTDETSMEEAMAQISTYFESVQPASAQPATNIAAAHGAHANPDAQMSSVPDAGAENAALPQENEAARDPSEDTVMTPAPPVDATSVRDDGEDVIASSSVTEAPSTESQFPSLQQNEPSTSAQAPPKFAIYSAPTNDTPFAAQQAHNESDFAPSVEHAQVHQALLNRLSQNKRLQSDKELEDAAATRKRTLTDTKSVTLRVRFPDQMQAVLTMTREDSVSGLYTTIRGMLEAPDQKFELRYVSSRGRPETLDSTSEASLIKDLGMVGRVLVTMVWDSSVNSAARQQPALKIEYRECATKLDAALPKEEEVVDESKKDEKRPELKTRLSSAKSSMADKEARMMKMLGFGKK